MQWADHLIGLCAFLRQSISGYEIGIGNRAVVPNINSIDVFVKKVLYPDDKEPLSQNRMLFSIDLFTRFDPAGDNGDADRFQAYPQHQMQQQVIETLLKTYVEGVPPLSIIIEGWDIFGDVFAPTYASRLNAALGEWRYCE